MISLQPCKWSSKPILCSRSFLFVCEFEHSHYKMRTLQMISHEDESGFLVSIMQSRFWRVQNGSSGPLSDWLLKPRWQFSREKMWCSESLYLCHEINYQSVLDSRPWSRLNVFIFLFIFSKLLWWLCDRHRITLEH